VGPVQEQEGVAGDAAITAQRTFRAELEVGARVGIDLGDSLPGGGDEAGRGGGEEEGPANPPAADLGWRLPEGGRS
jgi:hypothetical protein